MNSLNKAFWFAFWVGGEGRVFGLLFGDYLTIELTILLNISCC